MTAAQKDVATTLFTFHHAKWVDAALIADRLGKKQGNVCKTYTALEANGFAVVKLVERKSGTQYKAKLTPQGRKYLKEKELVN